MSVKANNQEAEEFFKLAKDDLVILKGQLHLLKLMTDDIYLKSACFYASQCTEKLMKYLIINRSDTGVYVHDIRKLNFRCEQLGIAIPKMITEYENELTNWAIATRYKVKFKTEMKIVLTIEKSLVEWVENIEAVEASLVD